MAMRLVPNGTGGGTDSGSVWVATSLMASDSANGPNRLTVVDWKMGAGAPLSGVIPTGGSVGPDLLWGVSIHSSSMWYDPPSCCESANVMVLLEAAAGVLQLVCGVGQRHPRVVCFFLCD